MDRWGNSQLDHQSIGKRCRQRRCESNADRLSATVSQSPQARGAGNTMKSSTKNQAEGKFHKVKGKLREIAGKLGTKPKLEAEGKDEKIAGKVQEKIGQVENVLGK